MHKNNSLSPNFGLILFVVKVWKHFLNFGKLKAGTVVKYFSTPSLRLHCLLLLLLKQSLALVVVVNKPLADEVFVVLDGDVQLLELLDLENHNRADDEANQKERVDPSWYQYARHLVCEEDRQDGVGEDVRNCEGAAETRNQRRRQVADDKLQIHFSQAVTVSLFDSSFQLPVGTQHDQRNGNLRVEHSERPVLPKEQHWSLVYRNSQWNNEDELE